MKTPEQLAQHAANERQRRKNYTPEQKEDERARGRRRYAEIQLDPERRERRRIRMNRNGEKQRRAQGVPERTTDPEIIRQNRRAKETRYWGAGHTGRRNEFSNYKTGRIIDRSNVPAPALAPLVAGPICKFCARFDAKVFWAPAGIGAT